MRTSAPVIEVWHDYICPFSYVLATRIMRLKEVERLDLAVRYRPWPLEAANGTQPAAADEAEWVRLLRRVEPETFTPLSEFPGFWPSSSAPLFAAYEAALAQDVAVAARFDLKVRQAIFQRPRALDSIERLGEVASEVGLDVPTFQASLADGTAARGADTTAMAAGTLDIRGIPTVVLPDGSKVFNPGLRVENGDREPVIHDDFTTLRHLLRRAAGVMG